MALTYQVDSLDGLDESVASLYEEGDNGYVLKVEGIPETGSSTQEEPVALKETLKKVRSERKVAEKENKQLSKQLNELKQKYGSINFDEIEELKAFHETAKQREDELKQEEAKKRGEWEALEQQLKEKHMSELEKVKTDLSSQIESLLKEKDTALNEMQTSLDSQIKDRDVTEAIAKAKGNLTLVKPHVLPQVKIMNEDGVYVTRVVDRDGEVRMNDMEEPMSVDELIQEIKSKPEFQGDGIFEREKTPGGSGSTGNKAKAPTKDNPWAKESWNLTRQGQIIKSDPALAEKLKAEIGA